MTVLRYHNRQREKCCKEAAKRLNTAMNVADEVCKCWMFPQENWDLLVNAKCAQRTRKRLEVAD